MRERMTRLAVAACVIAAIVCAVAFAASKKDVPSARTMAVDVEVYLPNFMRDSTPIVLQPLDESGGELDQVPISYGQIKDSRTTVYMQDRARTVRIEAPVNPDGSTYAIDGADGMPVSSDETLMIVGDLTDAHANGGATTDEGERQK